MFNAPSSPTESRPSVSSPAPMLEVSGIDEIVDPDRVDHMPCRPRQVLAYVGACSPWVSLLKYSALGSTFDVYRHCVILGQSRWSYEPPYAQAADLSALGFEMHGLGNVDLARAVSACRVIDGGRVLLFYAPIAAFEYYTTFLRQVGARDPAPGEHHSFMLAGISADRGHLLFVDNANPAHRYTRVVVPFAVVADGWAADPDNWFLDTVMLGKAGEPDLGAFSSRYLEVVEGFDDRFDVYGLIADQLPGHAVADPDRSPSLAMLRMLAGSRTLFHEFLCSTNHGRPVTAAYRRLARHLTALTGRVSLHLSGRRSARPDDLRRDLRAMPVHEEKARQALRCDLRSIRLTFLPPSYRSGRS